MTSMRVLVVAVLVLGTNGALPKLPPVADLASRSQPSASIGNSVPSSSFQPAVDSARLTKRSSVFDPVSEANQKITFSQGSPAIPPDKSKKCNHFLSDGTVEINYCEIECPQPQVVIDDGTCCGKCGFKLEDFKDSNEKMELGGGDDPWRPDDIHLMTSRDMSWSMSSPHSGKGNCHVSRVRAQSTCPRQCTGHGFCGITAEQKGYKFIASTVQGKCYCRPGWRGYDCSQENAQPPTAIIIDSGNPKAEFLAEKTNVITMTIISPDKLRSVAVSEFRIGNDTSFTNFQITAEEGPPSNVWVVAYAVTGVEQGPVSFKFHIVDYLDRDSIVTSKDSFVRGKVAVTNFVNGAKYWRIRSLAISMGGYIPDYAWTIRNVNFYKTDDMSKPVDMNTATVLASSEDGTSCGFLGVSCEQYTGEQGNRFRFNLAVTSSDMLRFSTKLISFPRLHGPRMLQPGNSGKYIGVGKLSHCASACEDTPTCNAFTYSSNPGSFGCLLHTTLSTETQSSGTGQTTYYKDTPPCIPGTVADCSGKCRPGKGRDYEMECPTEGSTKEELRWNCTMWGCGSEVQIPFGMDLMNGFAEMTADPYYHHVWKAADNAPDEWISFGFDGPQQVSSIRIQHPDSKKAPASMVLEQSNDFINWMPVVVLDGTNTEDYFTVLPSVYDAATAQFNSQSLLQKYDAFEDTKLDFSTMLEDQLLVDLGTGQSAPIQRQVIPHMKFCYYTLDAAQVNNMFKFSTYDEPAAAIAGKFYVPRQSGYISLPSRDLVTMPVHDNSIETNTSFLELEAEKQMVTGLQVQEDDLDEFGCDTNDGYTWCPYSMSCVQDYAGGDGGPCQAPSGSLEPPTRPPTAFVFHDESPLPGFMIGNVSVVPAMNSHLDESITGYSLYFTDRESADIMYIVDKKPILFIPKPEDAGGVVVGYLDNVTINENATHLLLVSTNNNGDMNYGITRPIQEQYNIYGNLGAYRTARCAVWRPGGPGYHDVQGFTFAPENSFLQQENMAVRFGGHLSCSDPGDPSQVLVGQGIAEIDWVMFHSPDGTNTNAKVIPTTKDGSVLAQGTFQVNNGECKTKLGGALSQIDVSGYVDLFQAGYVSMWFKAKWLTSDPGDYALVCDSIDYEVARGATLEVDQDRAPSIFYASSRNPRGSEDAVIQLFFDKPTKFSGSCDSDEGMACVRTWLSAGCPAAIPELPGLTCDADYYSPCYTAPDVMNKCGAHRNCDSDDATKCIANWLQYECPPDVPDLPPQLIDTGLGFQYIEGIECAQFIQCTVEPILNGECGEDVEVETQEMHFNGTDRTSGASIGSAQPDYSICTSDDARFCLDSFVASGCPDNPEPQYGTTNCLPYSVCYPLARLAGRCDAGPNYVVDEGVDDYRKYTKEYSVSASPAPSPLVPSESITPTPSLSTGASPSITPSVTPTLQLPIVGDIGKSISDGVEQLGKGLQGVTNGLSNALTGNDGGSVFDSFGDAASGLGSAITGGFNGDAASGGSGGEYAGQEGQTVSNGVTEVGAGLSNVGSQAGNAVSAGAQGISDGVGNVASTVNVLGPKHASSAAQRHAQMAQKREAMRQAARSTSTSGSPSESSSLQAEDAAQAKRTASVEKSRKKMTVKSETRANERIREHWKRSVQQMAQKLTPQQKMTRSRMQPHGAGHHEALVQTEQGPSAADVERYEQSRAKWEKEQEQEDQERVKVSNSLIKHLLDFKESQTKNRAEPPTGNQIAPPEVHRANNMIASTANAAVVAPQHIEKLADFKTLREEAKAKFKQMHQKDGVIGTAHIENEATTTPQDLRKAPPLAAQQSTPQASRRYPPAQAADFRPVRAPSVMAEAIAAAEAAKVIHGDTHVLGNPERKSMEQSKLEMVQKLRREHGGENGDLSFKAPASAAAALQPPAPGQLRRPQ